MNSASGEFYGRDTLWNLINPLVDNTYTYSIVGSSNLNVFMIGSFGLVVHWNGKSWHRYAEFFRKPDGDNLIGAWTDENEVLIVGYSERNKGIIYKGKMNY